LSEHGKRYRTGQQLARKNVPFSPYALKFFLFIAWGRRCCGENPDGKRMLSVTKRGILIKAFRVFANQHGGRK
jgi:hypothetical protein